MSEPLIFHFDVDGENFTSAGQASTQVKKNLRQLGLSPDIIRRVSIAMYEGEINMVIHANGGTADVIVTEKGSPPQRTAFAPWALVPAWAFPT